MKLYHLADLHIGKNIYGVSMIEDQKDWIMKFLDLCSKENPDAVLIAGDVYDRSSPSGEAVVLLDSFLTSLAELNIPVLMAAGNHDSGQRLSFGRRLFVHSQIHIAGSLQKQMDHVTLEDEYGEVTFWLMPYTYPEQINVLLNEEVRTYDEAVRTYLSKQEVNLNQRNVIVSHQNVVCNGKEAERTGSEAMVGGVGQIDYTAYDDFDYVALGHIHSSYSVGRKEVRYAGTPLCYHFAETKQKEKGPVEILLKEKGTVEIRTISIEPLHKMRYISDTKQNLLEFFRNDTGQNEYIGINVTDERITPEFASYLRQMLEHRGSILMELLSSYRSVSNNFHLEYSTEQKTLEQQFMEFAEEVTGVSVSEDEQQILEMIGELVRNQDCHLPINEKDAEKIASYAKEL